MHNITNKEEIVSIEFTVGEDIVREIVTGVIELGEQEPDIEKILEVRAFPGALETEITEGGVGLTGEISGEVIYLTVLDDPYRPQHSIRFAKGSFQFKNFVDIPDASMDMSAVADTEILRTSYRRLDERRIEISVTIKILVKVVESRRFGIITDLQGLTAAQIDEEVLVIDDVLGENTVITVLTEYFTVEDNEPSIERIVSVSTNVFDVKAILEKDGVLVSGLVESNVIYIGGNEKEDRRIQSVLHRAEFAETIPLPGAGPGNNAYPAIRVVNVVEDIVDIKTLELRIELEAYAKVTRPKEISLILDIDADNVDSQKELLHLEGLIGEKILREVISHEIVIAAEKPPLERIIRARADIIELAPLVEDGGITLAGQVEIGVLYEADVLPEDMEQAIGFMSVRVPFENYIPIADTQRGFPADTYAIVNGVKPRIVNDRSLEIEVSLEKFAKVRDLRPLEVVVDLVVISPVTVCPPSLLIYIVQPGDNLFKIARRYRTTVGELVDANKITDPDYLEPGQKISIPKRSILPKI